MSGKVWISSMLSNSEIGAKQGLRTKFYGEEWEPARFEMPPRSETVHENTKRYASGIALTREEQPEAAAIWDEKSFQKTHELFTSGARYVVRGKLAEILSRFNLGEGGLIPFPIYKADLKTPYPGEFFLLNFGARKNSLLPEECEDAQKWIVLKDTGQQLWKVNYLKRDAEVAMSPAALDGPDLWFEKASHNKIFMSDALASALIEAGLSEDWRLVPCKVVEAQS